MGGSVRVVDGRMLTSSGCQAGPISGIGICPAVKGLAEGAVIGAEGLEGRMVEFMAIALGYNAIGKSAVFANTIEFNTTRVNTSSTDKKETMRPDSVRTVISAKISPMLSNNYTKVGTNGLFG